MKTAKLSLYTLALGGLFMFASCGDEDQQFPYTVTVTDLTFGPVADEGHTQSGKIITSDLEDILSSYGVSLTNVKKLEPDSISLTITAPSNGNFDPFGTIEVYITAPGKDTVKIAYNEGAIPNGTNTIQLASQGNDIAEYFQDTEFSFIVKEYNEEPVTQQLTFDATARFQVQTSGGE